MNLAEQIIDHCQTASGEGYGAIMGTTLPLRDLIKNYVGKRTRISDGVDLFIPGNATWQTVDQADGGVQISFTGPLPVVYASKGPIGITPEITAVVLRLGSAAIEIQASPRLAHVPLPPYTITIPLA